MFAGWCITVLFFTAPLTAVLGQVKMYRMMRETPRKYKHVRVPGTGGFHFVFNGHRAVNKLATPTVLTEIAGYRTSTGQRQYFMEGSDPSQCMEESPELDFAFRLLAAEAVLLSGQYEGEAMTAVRATIVRPGS